MGKGETQSACPFPPNPHSHREVQLIFEVKDVARGSLKGFQDSAESLGDWLFFPSPSCALGEGPFVQPSAVTRNHCVLTMPLTAS